MLIFVFVHPEGLGRYTTSIPFGYILLSVEINNPGAEPTGYTHGV